MTSSSALPDTRPVSGPTLALAVLLVAAVFFRASQAPVAQVDSWSHWKYGEWIWEQRRLPEKEPFSPSGKSQQGLIDRQWLSQVLFYLAARGGIEGASLLYAGLAAARALLLLAAARRATGSLGVGVAIAALTELLVWPFTNAVNIQAPAEVCFAALLFAVAARVPSPASILGGAAVVGLWANLHGTVTFAFVLLAGLLVGRFLEQARARRGPSRAFRDPGLRRLLLLTLLSVAAAFLNPYGKELVLQILRPEGTAELGLRHWPNLIPVQSPETQVLLASLLLVLFTLRLSPRPFGVAEILLLTGFAISAWFDKRVALWWLLLVPWLLAPHGRAIVDRLTAGTTAGSGNRPGGRVLSVTALVLAGVLVILSPAVAWARGRPLPLDIRVGPSAPVTLVERLGEVPAEKERIVFCAPFLWSDYLMWHLPSENRVYWYSQPEHLTSPNLEDAATLLAEPSSPRGQEVLARHRIGVLVVSAVIAPVLYDYVKQEGPRTGWQILVDTGEETSGGRGLVAIRRAAPEREERP